MSNFSAPLDRLRRTGLPFRDGISARKLGEFHSGILGDLPLRSDGNVAPWLIGFRISSGWMIVSADTVFVHLKHPQI